LYKKGTGKMLVQLTQGDNFINILAAALAGADTKSAKKLTT